MSNKNLLLLTNPPRGGAGRDSAYKSDRNVQWKIQIEPLMETEVAVQA